MKKTFLFILTLISIFISYIMENQTITIIAFTVGMVTICFLIYSFLKNDKNDKFEID